MKNTTKRVLSIILSFVMTVTFASIAASASSFEEESSYELQGTSAFSAEDYEATTAVIPAAKYNTNASAVEKELDGEKSYISTVQGSSCWFGLNKDTDGNFCFDIRAFANSVDGVTERDSDQIRVKDNVINKWYNLLTIKSDGTIGSTSYAIKNDKWFNLRLVVNVETKLMKIYFGADDESMELISDNTAVSFPEDAKLSIMEITKGRNGAHIYNFGKLNVSYIPLMYKTAAASADVSEFKSVAERHSRLGFFTFPADYDKVDDEEFILEKLFAKRADYTSTTEIENFLSDLTNRHNVGIKVLSCKLLDSDGNNISSESLRGISKIKSQTGLVSTTGSEESINVVTALYEKSTNGDRTFCSYSVKNVSIGTDAAEFESDKFDLDAKKEYAVRVFVWNSVELPTKMTAVKNFNDFNEIEDINENAPSESITTEINVKPESGNINVIGNLSGGDGLYTAISVKSPSGKLVYADQVYTYGDNGSFTVPFTLSAPSEAGTYTVQLSGNNGINKTDTFNLESDTVKPSVNSVKIDGDTFYGSTVSLNYNYFQIGGVEEGTTKYSWYISDSEDGDYTFIPEKTEKTLVLDRKYSGKYIKASVVPVTKLNVEGSEAYAENIIRVVMLPEISDATIRGDAKSGSTISVVYKFVEPLFGYPESGTEYAWYKGSQLVGTEQSYKISDKDVGSYIKCVVTPKIAEYPYIGKCVETNSVKVTSSESSKGSSGGGSKGSSGGGSFTAPPSKSTGGEKVDDTTASVPSEDTKVFADSENHWAKDTISRLCARGVINGIDDTHFNPDGYVTRAEFAALINRILNTAAASDNMPFEDVEKSAWYYNDVLKIYSIGIMKGENGAFRPNDKITREEMALTISRVYTYKFGTVPKSEEKTGFSDYKDIAQWAYDAVMYCANAGILKGDTNGAFNPKANTTRAEAAVVTERVINLR